MDTNLDWTTGIGLLARDAKFAIEFALDGVLGTGTRIDAVRPSVVALDHLRREEDKIGHGHVVCARVAELLCKSLAVRERAVKKVGRLARVLLAHVCDWISHKWCAQQAISNYGD